ncbi:unnamed protein product, partial [Brenthis ino]
MGTTQVYNFQRILSVRSCGNRAGCKSKEIVHGIFAVFMERRHVNQRTINDINPYDKTRHLPNELLYLGIGVAAKINTPVIKADITRRKEFLNRCKDFLVKSAMQIKKRWNFNNEALIKINLLSPKNALSQSVREQNPTILSIHHCLMPQAFRE